MDLTCFRTASRTELHCVLAVQHEAFGRVARALDLEPTRLPPLQESADDLARQMANGTRFFVAVVGHEIVGAVRGTPRGDTVHVGRLVVATSHLRRGIGTRLMHHLEQEFPSARRFELFTGADAHDALALYEGLGYMRTRADARDGVRLVWLEKRR